jgi:hypothetical protein
VPNPTEENRPPSLLAKLTDKEHLPLVLWWGGAAIIFVPLGLMVLAGQIVMSSHPVNLNALGQVTESSTQADVRRLLGEPSRIHAGTNLTQWTYGGGWSWCIVSVRFDSVGQVIDVEHDH